MKIILSIPTHHLLLPDAAMALVPLLVNATPVITNGYGSNERFIESADTKIEVAIVRDDHLGKRPDSVQTLLDEQRSTSDRWLKEYQRANDLDKKVKELEAKIASFTDVVTSAQRPE